MKAGYIILLLIIGMGCATQAPPDALPPLTIPEIPYYNETFKSPGEWDEGELIFWHLENGENQLYFLGSVHLGREDFFPLDERIVSAYQECENLVLEVEMGEETMVTVTEWLFSRGVFDGDEDLYDYFTDEEIGMMDQVMKSYGFSLKRFRKMKPFVIENTIVAAIIEKMGYKAEYGIDLHFHSKALEEGKNVVPLETIEEQLHFLSSGSIESQAASLLRTFRQLEDADQTVNLMMEYWKTGNIEELESFLIEDFSIPHMLESYINLIILRNIRWVEKVEEMMARGGNWFIVGGAGHFVGDYSVIRLLRMKGYKVKRI